MKTRAAKLVAEQGPRPDEPRLTQEQAEELGELLIRSDALNNARTALEDLPEHEAPADRWVSANALAVAAERASEEFSRYKREIGVGTGTATV